MQDHSHDLKRLEDEKSALESKLEQTENKLVNLWKRTMIEKKKRAAVHQLEVDELIAKLAKLDINDKQLDDENRELDSAIVIY